MIKPACVTASPLRKTVRRLCDTRIQSSGQTRAEPDALLPALPKVCTVLLIIISRYHPEHIVDGRCCPAGYASPPPMLRRKAVFRLIRRLIYLSLTNGC